MEMQTSAFKPLNELSCTLEITFASFMFYWKSYLTSALKMHWVLLGTIGTYGVLFDSANALIAHAEVVNSVMCEDYYTVHLTQRPILMYKFNSLNQFVVFRLMYKFNSLN